ncbi:hypothetical protein SMA5143A_6499 [Streptomyces sp. MA5143a]|nr:hypothetical protein SMA5143A_6499 [Streptomyces sp. MA5143a]
MVGAGTHDKSGVSSRRWAARPRATGRPRAAVTRPKGGRGDGPWSRTLGERALRVVWSGGGRPGRGRHSGGRSFPIPSARRSSLRSGTRFTPDRRRVFIPSSPSINCCDRPARPVVSPVGTAVLPGSYSGTPFVRRPAVRKMRTIGAAAPPGRGRRVPPGFGPGRKGAREGPAGRQARTGPDRGGRAHPAGGRGHPAAGPPDPGLPRRRGPPRSGAAAGHGRRAGSGGVSGCGAASRTARDPCR